MDVFYGQASASFKGSSTQMQSMGAAINSEMHLLRFLAPISLGYRFTYIPDDKTMMHEVLIGINFSGFGGKGKK